MKNQKVLIYPYDCDFTPLLRHRKLWDGYEIVSLVSPGGWGLVGRDAGEADKGDQIGINITGNFEEGIELCDTVMFVDSHRHLDFRKYILPKVDKAVEHRKDIIFTIPLNSEDYNVIFEKCNAKGVDFKYLNYPGDNAKFTPISQENEFLHNINTPIVLVFGIGERTNKFEIQLSLREKFLNEGYKVGQIGTRGYCEMLGVHSFPKFMYDGAIPETNKIVLFNHLVKKIEKEEQPDVIIIGIPGGIMPFNNNLVNHFGILAYEVSQAVAPDSAVFSCHYAEYDSGYFTKMSDLIKYRFGCEINCYNIANVSFDWTNSKYENKMLYTSLDSNFIDEKITNYKTLGTPVFNVLNSRGAGEMADVIINALSEYGETACI